MRALLLLLLLSVWCASLPFRACRFWLLRLRSPSAERLALFPRLARARQRLCVYLASRGGAGIGTAAQHSQPSAVAAGGPALRSQATPSEAGAPQGKIRRNLLLKLRAEGTVTRQR